MGTSERCVKGVWKLKDTATLLIIIKETEILQHQTEDAKNTMLRSYIQSCPKDQLESSERRIQIIMSRTFITVRYGEHTELHLQASWFFNEEWKLIYSNIPSLVHTYSNTNNHTQLIILIILIHHTQQYSSFTCLINKLSVQCTLLIRWLLFCIQGYSYFERIQ